MKKTAFLVLAALMVLSVPLFAGGGRNNASSSVVHHPKYGDLAPVEFDTYMYQTTNRRDLAMVWDWANQYIKPKLNMKVNLHILGSLQALNERLATMVAAGQDFGIADTVNYVVNAGQGAYLALDDLIDKYAPGTKAEFSTEFWDAMRVNGKIYCIPSYKDNIYIMGAYYNETMLNRLGIDLSTAPPPHSWSKWETWLEGVKAKRDAVYGPVVEPIIGDWNLYPQEFAIDDLVGNGLAVLNIQGIMDIPGYDENTVFCIYESQAFREYAQARFRMVQKGLVADNYDDGKDNTWRQSGNMFMWPQWGDTYVPKDYLSNNWDSALLEPDRTWATAEMIFSSSQAISPRSKNPERHMMWIEETQTDPVLSTLFTFGIEGYHWNYNTNGETQMTDKNSDPSNRGMYDWFPLWRGNMFLVKAPLDLAGPNNVMMTKLLQFTDEAQFSTAFGLSVNTSSIQNEIAACANVVKEFEETLVKGRANSAAEVDRLCTDFAAKLKANGVDRIKAEVQTQVNAFVASR
jgi:putative aldouronate transport system substrate-binding protein